MDKFNVSKVAKNARVSRQAVYDTLNRKIQNPRATIILEIAKELNLNYSEVLEQTKKIANGFATPSNLSKRDKSV